MAQTEGKFEGLMEQLKELLRQEPYRSGARLPSERALAEQFGVNRSSLREAVRALVNQGLIETRRGSGTSLRQAPSDLFRAPLETLMLLGELPIEDFYATREVLEVHLAGEAATKHEPEQLSQLQAQLRRLNPSFGLDPASHWQANVEFHMQIALSSGNQLLIQLMRTLLAGVRVTDALTHEAVADPAESYQLHVDIVEAIARRHPGAARAAMRRHMRLAKSEWLTVQQNQPG